MPHAKFVPAPTCANLTPAGTLIAPPSISVEHCADPFAARPHTELTPTAREDHKPAGGDGGPAVSGTPSHSMVPPAVKTHASTFWAPIAIAGPGGEAMVSVLGGSEPQHCAIPVRV